MLRVPLTMKRSCRCYIFFACFAGKRHYKSLKDCRWNEQLKRVNVPYVNVDTQVGLDIREKKYLPEVVEWKHCLATQARAKSEFQHRRETLCGVLRWSNLKLCYGISYDDVILHTALPSCHTVCYADGTLVEETTERTRSLKQTEAWLCHQFCKGIRLGSLAAQKIESMFIHGSRGASFPTHVTMGVARVTMGSTLISGPRAGCWLRSVGIQGTIQLPGFQIGKRANVLIDPTWGVRVLM